MVSECRLGWLPICTTHVDTHSGRAGGPFRWPTYWTCGANPWAWQWPWPHGVRWTQRVRTSKTGLQSIWWFTDGLIGGAGGKIGSEYLWESRKTCRFQKRWFWWDCSQFWLKRSFLWEELHFLCRFWTHLWEMKKGSSFLLHAKLGKNGYFTNFTSEKCVAGSTCMRMQICGFAELADSSLVCSAEQRTSNLKGPFLVQQLPGRFLSSVTASFACVCSSHAWTWWANIAKQKYNLRAARPSCSFHSLRVPDTYLYAWITCSTKIEEFPPSLDIRDRGILTKACTRKEVRGGNQFSRSNHTPEHFAEMRAVLMQQLVNWSDVSFVRQNGSCQKIIWDITQLWCHNMCFLVLSSSRCFSGGGGGNTR